MRRDTNKGTSETGPAQTPALKQGFLQIALKHADIVERCVIYVIRSVIDLKIIIPHFANKRCPVSRLQKHMRILCEQTQ